MNTVPPPLPRPIRPRVWLRVTGLVLALFAGLLFVVFAPMTFNTWQAEHRWAVYVKRAQQRGVPLKLPPNPPAPLPSAENLAAEDGPFALDQVTSEIDAKVVTLGKRPQQVWTSHLDWLPFRALPKLRDGTRADFSIAAGVPSTPESTSSRPIPRGAADFLAAFDREFAAQWAQVLQAEAKPKAQFNIPRRPIPPKLQIPLLLNLNVTKIHALRATALLELGHHEEAAGETLGALRLARAFHECDEPSLITFMCGANLDLIAVEPIWEGLVDRLWSDDELLKLDEALARARPAAGWLEAMDGDRAFFNATLDDLAEAPMLARIQKVKSILLRFPMTPGDGRRNSRDEVNKGFLIGEGCFLNFIRDSQTAANQNFDAIRRQIDPSGEWRPEIAVPHDFDHASAAERLRCMYATLILPRSMYAAVRTCKAETRIRQARIAIALERYRRAKQDFPKMLADLAPEFLAEIPTDPFDRQVMRYQLDTSRIYRLWSVGENRVDDGGRLGTSSAEEKDLDIVWWGWPPVPGKNVQ